MRLLDLFCCEGGASVGYHAAGFEVVGVDIEPRPRYPFKFHQADALEFPIEGFDAIHASPPCQRFCGGHVPGRESRPDLIAATRDRLVSSGLPWVIENVPGAPIRPDIVLYGWCFGLPLQRKRHFETNWGTVETPPRTFHGDTVCITGTGTPTGTYKKLGRAMTMQEKRGAMGMDWASTYGLAQAIPPAYTEFIGKRLMEFIKESK